MDTTQENAQDTTQEKEDNRTLSWRELLDARMQNEVGFAVLYTTEYKHGTSGHLAYLTIATLAAILDSIGPRFVVKEDDGGAILASFDSIERALTQKEDEVEA